MMLITRKHAIALLIFFPFFSYLHAATVDSDDVVVTASRFSESVTSQSAGVQIITAAEIAASQAQSLPQLLSRYAGIYSRGTSDTADRQIDMRGFGATGDQNTAVILDGQRLNENELVTIKWSSIPIESIERIEIVRGSGAVLFGGGTTGGVIHIITKNPSKNTSTGYAEAGAGSYSGNKFRAGFSQAGELAGLSLHLSHEAGDGYRDNAEYRQDDVEGSLRLFNLPFDAEFKFGLEDRHQSLPGPREVDLNIGLNQLDDDRRGTHTPLDYADRNGWHFNLLTHGQWGNNEWNLDIGQRHTRRTALYIDDTNPPTRDITQLDTETDLTSISPRIKIPHQLLGGADSLIIGMDYERWKYQSSRENIFVLNPAQSFITPSDIHASQYSYAVYALERLNLSSYTRLSAGWRSQYARYKAIDRESFGNDKGEKNETERAYEIGLTHQLNSALQLYAKTGQSFRLPTLDEVYSYGTVDFLKPQTSKDHEVGIQYDAGTVHLRASVYRSRLDDEIHCAAPIRSMFDGKRYFGVCSNINLPPSERQGLELQANFDLYERLELSSNYTYADSEFLKGKIADVEVKGNEVPLVPKHKANLGFIWKIDLATRLSLNTLLVSDQRFDNDQSNTFSKKIPGYSVTDLSLEREIGPWKLSGTINNLFDREYYDYGIRGGVLEDGTQNYYAYPQAERTFYISGQYHW